VYFPSGLSWPVKGSTLPFTPSRFSPNESTAGHRGRCLRNMKLTQDTNINALTGIRNRGPSSETAANVRLRSQDELAVSTFIVNDCFIFKECWPNSKGVLWHRKLFHTSVYQNIPDWYRHLYSSFGSAKHR
jgi:hypothetical protein